MGSRLFPLAFFFLSFSVYGEEIGNLDSLSLEDLLDQKVSVASNKATSAKLSPGIVTVITAEEIKESGARDLMDVLYMVPGFHFAGEIYSSDGMGVRGFYTNEGRALFMIDGIMLNETLYGNVPLYNRYPVDHIQKIEIIRGPGSAIYGGFAELAVINITTKGAQHKNACEADTIETRMTKTYGRRNVSAYCSRGHGTLKWDAAFHIGQANRSNSVITNHDTTTVPATPIPVETKDANRIQPVYVNVGLAAGDFSARFLLDWYEVTTRTGYGTENITSPITSYWNSYNALLSYDFKVGESIKITPSYSYKYDTPWQVTQDKALTLSPFMYFDVRNERHVANLKTSVDFNKNFNLLVGVEGMQDHAHTTDPTTIFKVQANNVDYSSYSAFVQGLYGTDSFNVAVGARYEDHSEFDPAFVPRLAFTTQKGAHHLKALYSRAYRNPSIYNINSFDKVNYTLKPEETTAAELEYGFQFGPKFAVTGNIFDMQMDNPIVYISASDSYITYPKMATQGAEVEARTKNAWGFATVGYSYYRVRVNDAEKYRSGGAEATLAFPQHKLTGVVSYKLNDKLSVDPSIMIWGRNWTDAYDSNRDAFVDKKIDPRFILNLNVVAKNVVVSGLDASVGVHNILNQTNYMVVPYKSEHEDLPGPSRDIGMRLHYTSTF